MPALEVPVVPRKPWGFACLAMNVLLPGTGTLVAAGNQESRKHLAIGIVQLALFWLVLPWLWSILWGALILRASDPRPLPAAAPATAAAATRSDGPAPEARSPQPPLPAAPAASRRPLAARKAKAAKQ